MKRPVILIMLLCFACTAKSQILAPVTWSYAAKKVNKTDAVVLIKATIGEGWHIYSTKQPDGGPLKTTVAFKPSVDYAPVSNLTEPKPLTAFDSTYGINVLTFEKSVVFQQKIILKKTSSVVKGSVTFMVCNDHQCLSPETVEFSIPVK